MQLGVGVWGTSGEIIYTGVFDSVVVTAIQIENNGSPIDQTMTITTFTEL